jgi:hypothetical protein
MLCGLLMVKTPREPREITRCAHCNLLASRSIHVGFTWPEAGTVALGSWQEQ